MNGKHQDSNSGKAAFHITDSIDLSKVAMLVYQYKWQIFILAMVVACITFLCTLRIVPQFKTSALIQIKQENSKSNMLTQFHMQNAISNSDASVALIRSRYILEPVIKENNLNVSVQPHYTIFFEKWYASLFRKNKVIQIREFNIADDSPHRFLLRVNTKDNFQLFSSEGKLLVSGQVGKTYFINDLLKVSIAAIHANVGSQFTIQYDPTTDYLTRFAHSLVISNVLGNDPSQVTGIYQLQLTSSNPTQAVNLLNQIMEVAIQKNLDQKKIDTQNTLNFLDQRLPVVKKNLEEIENNVNQYHIKNTTLNMTIAGNILLQRLNTIKQEIYQLTSQKKALLEIYTSQYPLVIATEEKEKELYRQLHVLEGQIREFPIVNQQEINLMRESKIKNSMYVSLLASRQQYEVAKAGIMPDIMLLSRASFPERLPTHKLFITLASFLISVFLSIIALMIKSVFNRTIEDPDHLENSLKIPVQVVIPYSNKQKQLEKISEKTQDNLILPQPLLLAKQHPDDIAIESLRSLRISLHITASAESRVIATMGSIGNIGKSFVSLNLAQVFADANKRTLLIDADIRKGRLHKAFHQAKSPGLSEYLEKKYAYQELIRIVHDNLFYIPCGSYMTHPLALFQTSRFAELIQMAKQEFDQIIIDTPPLLPVTDAILIAKHCDFKLFVVSAFKDTLIDVKQSMKKAHLHGIEINGFVFNHRKKMFGHEQYRYAYETV